MTKDELKTAIRSAGVAFKSGLTKDELQDMHDRLFHKEEKPAHKPVELPDQEEEIQKIEQEGNEPVIVPDLDPDEVEEGEHPIEEDKPNEEKEVVTDGEFHELLGKIAGAKAPDADKQKTYKPLLEVTRKKKNKKDSSPDSTRLEGFILILIIDTAFPFTFSFVNNWLDKKVKIEATDLMLSEMQRKELEPLADQAADYLNVNVNPVVMFVLVSAFMYSNNLIILRMKGGSKNIFIPAA